MAAFRNKANETVHEEIHDVAAPINLKKTKIHPPEIIGSVRLSSSGPSSRQNCSIRIQNL